MDAGWARWGLAIGLVLSGGEALSETEGNPAVPQAGEGLDDPRRLQSPADISALCHALQLPLADEHGQLELPPAYEEAKEAIYQARVGPRGFALSPYRGASLSLRLDRGLAALKGALSLAVLQRDAGKFMLGPSEAKAIQAAVDQRKVALDVVFSVDHRAGELTPCFSLPHSEAASLRVRPISYELVDVDSGTVMARTRTPEHARLRALRGPGPRAVNITVSHATGVRKADDVEKVLKRREAAFAGCLVKDRPEARPEDVVGLSAYVAPAGRLSLVRAEIASMDDAKVSRCLEQTLRQVVLPPSRTPSRIGVVVELVKS